MNAPERLLPRPPESHDPSAWLDPLHGPWALDFERWPPDQAQRWRCVLARAAGGRLALLAARPCDALLQQVAEGRLGRRVTWVVCDEGALAHWLGSAETGFRALSGLADAGADAAGEAAPALQELSALHLAEQASPVVRLLDAVLFDALQDGASDIHIETTARGALIRLRIDGVMAPLRQIDGAALAEQLVSRLKVMAELDIGERRLPQDGRFKLRMQGREIDFRLSIMPSVFGEDAVVRVLDRAAVVHGQGALTLDSVGLDPLTRAALRGLARLPHGMLLVTGPTGSGKTTTLYAAIGETLSGQDKVITIEDPVEYQLPGVVQIPVNEKKGLTFARGLRSILRHDPDRVMVGEIRDPETAQIAVQAALTGHLVFSTVHANSAFDVIGRFMHMGLDLYNVVSALNAVLAQRLMRQVCPHCAQPHAPAPDLLQRLGLQADAGRWMKGAGCALCRGSGYRGRAAVAELLRLDDGLRDLIAARAPMSQIKLAARERGMNPLRDVALAQVRAGLSTFEELDRVTLDA
ncbi:type II secretory pathway, ATPase PulE/Tfp pilus assembly pathway, ATPase PilB [Burkholderiales bacterium JOSHI_001]|nr:type II secretory pathway, ATPase PulE/Tfp pilus assembly pathway, ATPase PilB [Burkholderiales bacterium JOSHI_001]